MKFFVFLEFYQKHITDSFSMMAYGEFRIHRHQCDSNKLTDLLFEDIRNVKTIQSERCMVFW
jgi:hypothetical protein